jgi:acylglycerol lipase
MTFATMSLETQEAVRDSVGRKMPVRAWRPLTPIRAVVVICHDRRTSNASWAPPANRLVDAGCAVYALGLRGYRRPVRLPVPLSAIRADLDDLSTAINWVETEESDRRLFLVGDYAACVVVRTFALRRRAEFVGRFGESLVYNIPPPAETAGHSSVIYPDLGYAEVNPVGVPIFSNSRRGARLATG